MVATTKTGKIASAMIAAGRGSTMYNDKLVGGRRSLKVLGWTQSDYRNAKRLLEQEGCKVEVVNLPDVVPGYSAIEPYLRLHVTE